jgi:vitamin B12/bleomycin/antimicrobial peptide transport system ATP-binding/permease protein
MVKHGAIHVLGDGGVPVEKEPSAAR